MLDIQTVKPRAVRRFGTWFVRCSIARGAHPNLDKALLCWRANRLHAQRLYRALCA